MSDATSLASRHSLKSGKIFFTLEALLLFEANPRRRGVQLELELDLWSRWPNPGTGRRSVGRHLVGDAAGLFHGHGVR